MNGKKTGGRPPVPVEHKGIKYPSRTAACKALGLPLAMVTNRMVYRNLSFTEAVEMVTSTTIVFDGVTYSSRNKLCESLGISSYIVRYKIHILGMTVHEAIAATLTGRRYTPNKAKIPWESLSEETKLICSAEWSEPIDPEVIRKYNQRGIRYYDS